ncbi:MULTISPECIES: hypothetical protein [Paenibacillus]|uniref:hypothetical protein n=1 Tax=Paenibacillus TaxID=44249 RepID=UPI0022B89A3E|nr:hypothetical protein [Paenibacillus caseinilyticus]MCZ8518939.1 hypothetical protein [Paenibacillus caseinilyticus]
MNECKQIGFIKIESEFEEGSGVIILSKSENNYYQMKVAQSHKYGMIAEIELNSAEFSRLVGAFETAYKMIFEGVFHQERHMVDIIYLTDSKPKRQGTVIINIIRDYIVLVVSLTYGGDPDLIIDLEQTKDLIEICKRALKRE